MSWLSTQFTWISLFSASLQLVQTLAWPLTFIVMAILFRLELRQVLHRLAKLKVRDFEAEFRSELNQAESLPVPRASLAEPPPKNRVMLELDHPEGRTRLAEPILSTRELVRRSWAEVEGLLERKDLHALVGSGLLEPSALAQLERLRSLARLVDRNLECTPSRADAERFRHLAHHLQAQVGSVPG